MNAPKLIKGLGSLSAFLVFFSCTLHVDKMTLPSINDRNFTFSKPNIGIWQQDSVFRFCCNGTISTDSETLSSGDYVINLDARGTPAYSVYPHLRVMLNDDSLTVVQLDSTFKLYQLPVTIKEEQDVAIKLTFDQDGADPQGNDRDVLIRRVTMEKKK